MKTVDCNYKIYNPSMVLGDGCYVTDENAKRYLDFESGVWCLALGHGHPKILKAIQNQLGRMVHTGYRYTTPMVEEAAEAILEKVGMGEGKCVFLASGSEAVECMVQAAKGIMDRPLFVSLRNDFLSSYGLSAQRRRSEWLSLDLEGYTGEPKAFLQNLPFQRIGAFVFEPGNASGTAALPPVELVQAIARTVQAAGGLLLIDEVTTGIGRTGKWFGFEHYGLRPDMVACGKGLGNGYPVSVAAFAKDVAQRVESSGFRYAQSHQNDPLGAAVALAVLRAVEEENLIAHGAEMGQVLGQALESLVEKHSCIQETRGRGLMRVLVFRPDGRLPLEQIHRELFEAGYIAGVNPGAGLLRFYPPLVVRREMIEGLTKTLDEILDGHM